MKLIPKNFNGQIPMDYTIVTRKHSEEDFVTVELHVRTPGSQAFTFMDLVMGVEGKNYAENLRLAYLKAEDTWNIDLLQFENATL